MTTIAWDGRYLAADSRTTAHDTIMSDESVKIIITGDYVIAISGSTDADDILIEAIKNGQGSSKKNSGAIFLTNNKAYKCSFGEDGELWICPSNYKNSIGTGRDHALTAMDLGCTAMDAIKFAIKRDTGSGGLIRYYDTKSKERKIETY
ncbi:MAG: hypothetical protein JKY50_00685 [Oleispira sp.]|nr:hypothetical protein [Oleispira sp.]